MNWRIGAVSYLNTKPLIYGLREHLPASELILDLPSRLADRLAAGELDVALIPSVEFLRGDGLEIVSDACIACRGPVRSVRVLFRKPPSQVKTLALDEGSRTSAALAQVLLAERFGVRPARQQLDINAEIADCTADAILVIGDRAMSLDLSQYCESWDLGEEWLKETGLPFVFAMWVSRGSASPEISDALEQARDSGLANLDEIVAQEAPKYNLSSASCEEYFRRHLHFYLGERERAGLTLFSKHADSLGLTSRTNKHFSSGVAHVSPTQIELEPEALADRFPEPEALADNADAETLTDRVKPNELEDNVTNCMTPNTHLSASASGSANAFPSISR